MDIDAISAAATVALTSTILFLLVAKSWSALSRNVGSTPSFADSIMHEAAQRFRDELDRLSSSQAIYLSGTLVFLVLFAAAYILQAQDLFAGYPSWQLWLQIGFLALAAAFAAWRLGRTILARRHVSFVRDANVAVGHQLQRISTGANRVFHDIKTSAGVVDHVLVGQTGIYADQRRCPSWRKEWRSGTRQDNELSFSNNETCDSNRRHNGRAPLDSRKKFANCWATRFGCAQSSPFPAGTSVNRPAIATCSSTNAPLPCCAAGRTSRTTS